MGAISNFIELVFVNNFYCTAVLGGLLRPVVYPETEWMYAYSQNETLLDMSLEELSEVENLKMYYLQLDSLHKCMPAGGNLAYDTHTIYTFIDLIGFGHGDSSGYLRTWFRDDPLEVDFGEDFISMGGKGSGLWGHLKCKTYLFIDCLFDLGYIMLLVLITGKLIIHGAAKFQTKQIFARHTNMRPELRANSENNQ